MDLSNSEATTSTPPGVLMKYYSNNAPFRSTYRRQAFPFRDTLINYITNNPASSKLYQKMIESWKHFFIKNPIFIVPELYFEVINWYAQGNRHSKDLSKVRLVYLNEITRKIWITDSLDLRGSFSDCKVLTSFMPQIYQCDAASINIDEQMFSFNDFVVIASKCEILHLQCVVIMNNDEKVPETSLEALFKVIPNVKTFTYILPDNSLNIITTKTAEELLKIPHFLSLNEFEIDFSAQISDEYETRLQTIVDEILETENREYKLPWISFSGITNSSFDKFYALHRQN